MTFCLSVKNGGREIHPLAALYPIVRLYPTGDRSGEITYSKVATPGTNWSVLPPGGAPPPRSLSPPGLWDMGPTPGGRSGTFIPGWLPPVPLELHSPRKPQLVPVSVTWSNQEYFYFLLDRMLVHHKATPSRVTPIHTETGPIWTTNDFTLKLC